MERTMSHSKTSRSKNLKDLNDVILKSKVSLSSISEQKPPCPCNSIDTEQQDTLDGLTLSLNSTNSESRSINNGDKSFKYNVFLKEVSRHEASKDDDIAHGNDMSSNIKEMELSRMLKDPDDEYKSISDMISFVDCGEPMPTQYLRLDFNPVKGVDKDEFRLKKCADFWKLINEHPELKTLKVEAEEYDFNESDSFVSFSETPSCSVTTESPESMTLTPITLQALHWLEKEKVMTDSFATNPLGWQTCEPVCKSYLEYSTKRKDDWPEIKKHRRQEFKPLASCLSLGNAQKSVTDLDAKTRPVDDVVQMMAEMHKWDLEHPKSLDPPVHEKLERTRRIVPYIEKNDDKFCEKCLH